MTKNAKLCEFDANFDLDSLAYNVEYFRDVLIFQFYASLKGEKYKKAQN